MRERWMMSIEWGAVTDEGDMMVNGEGDTTIIGEGTTSHASERGDETKCCARDWVNAWKRR